MIPEISEFSYGFALTNELVGWTALNAAPVVPSLIEEGKKGGGYDVKLDLPGVPLYLQFKRADCLLRSNAKEITNYGLPLQIPFFRFPITQKSKSFQHTSLVELDKGSNLVYYAAPRFHLVSENNDAWKASDVAARSIFVAPSAIGLIHDSDPHHVSYDPNHAYFCSEPIEIAPLSAVTLLEEIGKRLSTDDRPVRKQLPEWLAHVRETRTRARQVQTGLDAEIKAMKKTAIDQLPGGLRTVQIPRIVEPDVTTSEAIPPSEIREGRMLSEDEDMLRAIADEALHGFGTQFFVVQAQSK